MDHATPNLPSRNFAITANFYGALGFTVGWRDEGWMILKRNGVVLEFFPDPNIDPASTGFSCCLRLDDLDAFYTTCLAVGVPQTNLGAPRLHPPTAADSGLRIAALIDPDGTLLRLIQNPK
ncbi:bleomycin resistance protein [Bradyrhizobium centrosematis]|uniref:bleomycin resistance protein n=1 Tax=Bradyrhizobium centrosematis TaxID=1300039 RepID=UPI00388F561C